MAYTIGGRNRVYTGMFVHADYKADRKSIARLAVSDRIKDLLEDVITTKALPFVLEAAASFSDEEGKYVKGLKPEHDFIVFPTRGPNAIYPLRRVVARLVATARHSTVIEVGRKSKNPDHPQNGHHPLRRALEYIDATSRG